MRIVISMHRLASLQAQYSHSHDILCNGAPSAIAQVLLSAATLKENVDDQADTASDKGFLARSW